MTAPPQDLDNPMTMDEIEASLQDTATPTTDPTTVKLEGEKVPETLRGKTLAEVLDRQEKLEQSLRLSEAERLALRNRPEAEPKAPEPPPVEEYKPLTKEQIQALYEEDPLKAFEAMQNDALMRADQHFNQRFSRIEGSVATTQESWAQQQFGDEFKVLGKEIKAMVDKIPDKRVLNTKEGWSDLVAYVRGQEGNFEKLWEYKSKGTQPKDPASARAEQAEESGFSPRPTTRSAPPKPDQQLDATTREIAQNLGLTEAEYIKWANIGRTQ